MVPNGKQNVTEKRKTHEAKTYLAYTKHCCRTISRIRCGNGVQQSEEQAFY